MSNLKTFLCDLQVFVDKINSTTSRKEKQEILKSDGEPFKEIMAHVHNDFITHGITSKLVKRQLGSEGHVWVEITPTDTVNDLWVLLNGFANRSYTGGRAVGMWCNLIITHKEHTELLLNILDKDFRFRMGAKDINAVFPNLIPEFSVALAEKFGDGKNSELIEKGEWFISQKCDGIRLVAIKQGLTVNFFSRSGNEYLTLNAYAEEIVRVFGEGTNLVLDGELIMKSGNSDDFRAVMKQVTKKDHQITDLTYMVFDMLWHEEFFLGTSVDKLEDRLEYLQKLANLSLVPDGKIQILEQHKHSTAMFEHLVDQVHEHDWEGLIFRKNEVYKGKRSKDILKWKEFHDAEYTVTGIESGTSQVIVDGQNQIVDIMGKAIVMHKGNEVGVGSGWSQDQRIEFHKDPSKIIGKVITVKYKKESVDENGKLSLQFPVVKIIHGDKRTT